MFYSEEIANETCDWYHEEIIKTASHQDAKTKCKLETKNNEIISQNKKLLARLENLENIAFKFQEEDKYKLSKSISE